VVHRDGKCIIDTPKSKKGRKVVAPPHIRQAIKHHLATYVTKGADALAFPADRSCHLSDKTFRRYFAAALKDIGRDGKKKPRPSIHDLRHFAGTQTARVGNLGSKAHRHRVKGTASPENPGHARFCVCVSTACQHRHCETCCTA
jgi:integrase